MIALYFISCIVFGLCQNEVEQIGKRIFQNECGGDSSKLVYWNSNEAFVSCGIGHFIWIHELEQTRQPFEDQFSALLAFLNKHYIVLPDWISMSYNCPWKTRIAWLEPLAQKQSKELCDLLEKTIGLQCQFIIERFNQRIKKVSLTKHALYAVNQLQKTSKGIFALIDYAHFKGFGDNPRERYNDQGWGLCDVLENISFNKQDLIQAFIQSAQQILKRRVLNAPADRKKQEEQWLHGWVNRVNRYNI